MRRARALPAALPPPAQPCAWVKLAKQRARARRDAAAACPPAAGEASSTATQCRAALGASALAGVPASMVTPRTSATRFAAARREVAIRVSPPVPDRLPAAVRRGHTIVAIPS
jgi:hypothetical protein